MLVEFRVKNFRSIRDEQIFSMVADNGSEHADSHLIAEDLNTPALLKSAVIYGANASGKSNLLNAAAFVLAKLSSDAALLFQGGEMQQEGFNRIKFQSFKLDSVSENKPSEFEITFSANSARYQYGFSVSRERIIEEWLTVYQKGQPQKWFERTYDHNSGQYIYTTSKYLTGQKALWQKATRPDALFLVTAAALNSSQLRQVLIYLLNTRQANQSGAGIRYAFENEMAALYKDAEYRGLLVNFIKNADLGIHDIEIVRETTPQGFLSRAAAPESSTGTQKFTYRPLFLHKNGDTGETVKFELEDESDGTRRFFWLAFRFLDAVINGKVLFIDELENSLHPAMTKAVVGLFNSVTNKYGQLIFTTHSTELMSTEIFRRDQIWFVEKHQDGASELYPLTDFSPRKNEKIAARYLAGCYGAVPFVRDFMEQEQA